MWRELPSIIEIELTYTCNLRCRMCHVSFMPDEPRPQLDPDLIDHLSVLRGVWFVIGSGFEPMMNRSFVQIVHKLTAINAAIELITNGTLLTPENVSALLDADLRQITFSFDGIEPATYEHIRRRSKHRETLHAIVEFRRRFQGRRTLFSINSTMMRRNLSEVPAMVDFWDTANFDLIRLIAMVIRENDPELIRESLYPVRMIYQQALDAAALDVINNGRKIALRDPWYERTPLRAEYPEHFRNGFAFSNHPDVRLVPNMVSEPQLGAGPGMTFPCKSPWTFAKILPNSEVQLCYRFSIGNLHEQTFEKIWFGEQAEAVRQRLAAERELCETCDYFRFCLNSGMLDGDNVQSYLAGDPLAGVDNIDWLGTMPEGPPRPPILVETASTFNIVRFKGAYLGVPHALGPMDLSKQVLAELPGLIMAPTLHEARRRVQAAIAASSQQRSTGTRTSA